MKFLKQPVHLKFFENSKRLVTNFRAKFFAQCFDKKFSFGILHKLAKFHYQTEVSLQVIR